VQPGLGSLANLDSLVQGKADLAIVDNFAPYQDSIKSILPIYKQILHILHRADYEPKNLKQLLEGKKVFAGSEASGSWRFIHQLINDQGINQAQIEWVDVLDLFEADVIIVFTDLLSPFELQDLKGYKLYSLDDPTSAGNFADAICLQHPQFQPYVLPQGVYGRFTPSAVQTVSVAAVLVGRANLSNEFVFQLVEQLQEHKQEIAQINPLLHRFSGDFDPHMLTFTLHEGARQYLDRYSPSFLEKNADLIGIALSIALALASASFSISRWQKTKKKDKIDIYYNKLIELRKKISESPTLEEIHALDHELKAIQEETIGLVTSEKLLADESFSIFLELSRFIRDEIHRKGDQV
jgi:TRAP-type uncharacterized transport system substrate-binding protein